MLDPEKIRRGLNTQLLAKKVLYFPRVDSTNKIALELGRKGSPEGTMVIAEEQTAGRGRWRRKWHSPPEKSLLFS
ncbi:MAG TPA: biotin--[acetyl-CoA-carboxylase] ligase, partial [Syntrophaceticus sp.]|nr:biotin--[acetyl-CoA-carboxylase] ligase [Syntrophaceticus sp.]